MRQYRRSRNDGQHGSTVVRYGRRHEHDDQLAQPHSGRGTVGAPKKHQLDLRVAEEYWDVEAAEEGIWPEKYVVIVRPKSTDPGTVAPMAAADTSGEYAVYYYAAYRDGQQLWEIDKRNMKCVIMGTDYMADVRKALGK